MSATVQTDAIRAIDGQRTAAAPSNRRSFATAMFALAVAAAVFGPSLVSTPAERGAVLMAAAMTAWAAAVVPDFVVGLGVIVAWNLAGVGPASVSMSGFASPTWMLLLSVLTLGVALNQSGLLRRLALHLLGMFPSTFVGQSVALLVAGAVATPLLPLTVARCGLTAPLVVKLAEGLGYRPQSRSAVGLGLAGFVGSGLLSRCFMTGATLNLIAWGLLPADARIGWALWAVAAIPVTILLIGGPLVILLARFAPRPDRPVASDVIASAMRQLGPASRSEWIAGAATLAAVAGFGVGPYVGIHSAWIACAAALIVTSLGVVTTDQFKASIDWPLLIFLGVVLSLPDMIRHTGLESAIAAAIQTSLANAEMPVVTLVLVFLATVAARFVLSEWVAVPLLTVALAPVAATGGFHPWLIVFVVLLGANMWSLPYQYASYLAYYSGSNGRLFEHGQVRLFSIAFMVLSLVGIVASVPLWRLLGLLPN